MVYQSIIRWQSIHRKLLPVCVGTIVQLSQHGQPNSLTRCWINAVLKLGHYRRQSYIIKQTVKQWIILIFATESSIQPRHFHNFMSKLICHTFLCYMCANAMGVLAVISIHLTSIPLGLCISKTKLSRPKITSKGLEFHSPWVAMNPHPTGDS